MKPKRYGPSNVRTAAWCSWCGSEDKLASYSTMLCRDCVSFAVFGEKKTLLGIVKERQSQITVVTDA